jgi:membrane-bound ClpP family serine protease
MTVIGIVLLVAGALVAASEVHAPTHGISGTAGILLMAVGVVLALSSLGSGLLIGLGAGVLLAGAGVGGLTAIVRGTATVSAGPPRGGSEGLIGRLGLVRDWSDAGGSVSLDGAVWNARRCASVEEDEVSELHAGDRVVVVSLNGLTLSVRPAEEWELL